MANLKKALNRNEVKQALSKVDATVEAQKKAGKISIL